MFSDIAFIDFVDVLVSYFSSKMSTLHIAYLFQMYFNFFLFLRDIPVFLTTVMYNVFLFPLTRTSIYMYIYKSWFPCNTQIDLNHYNFKLQPTLITTYDFIHFFFLSHMVISFVNYVHVSIVDVVWFKAHTFACTCTSVVFSKKLLRFVNRIHK